MMDVGFKGKYFTVKKGTTWSAADCKSYSSCCLFTIIDAFSVKGIACMSHLYQLR